MIQLRANDAADSLSGLKLQLKSILDLFDPKSQIFYIDYPTHRNVGDLLINKGTEQFFVDYKIPIHQRYSALDIYDPLNLKGAENATFLCSGGGNFGDLYSRHQAIRESLMDKFPRARIIFLPQSLYYSSKEAQQASLEKIARHSNCHILVRDQESLDTLRQAGIAQSSMMPDMAHQLWGTFHPLLPSEHKRDIYFLRRDREATPPPAEFAEAFTNHSVDWDDIISTPHRVLAGGIYHFLKVGGRVLPMDIKASMWYSVRDAMIRDAVTYFSNHDRVYTNRLHAMLLGMILGLDLVVFDNSYGKLSRYVNAWLAAAVQPGLTN